VYDEQPKRRIQVHARQLWETDGGREGRGMDYWIEAKEELFPHSVAREEDPIKAFDHGALETPGSREVP
jgi:hypothetical protein